VFTGGDGFGEMTSVVADAADPNPTEFIAVTTTRSLQPTSLVVAWNDCAVAPAMLVQPAPAESQRCHW
jgi:hypothetical protein